MTYDGATIRLFVNAVEVSSLAAPGAVMSTANPLSIGGNSVWNNEWFAGRLDEIRIYNRALTPAQIQTDMKTPVGGTPNPDTTAPTVKMTAPAHGAFVGASVSVAATATDTVGVIASGVKSVQFLLDGSPLGLPDTASPFGLTWTTAGTTAGLHTLAARATDAAGNQATSTSISVTIDRTRPSVALTAPAAGATVSSIVTISANASDNGAVQSVQFTVDGADLGARDSSAPYSIAWNTSTVANGTHRLTAIARDTAGNPTTSATVTVTVSNTTTQPTGLVAAYGFNEVSGTGLTLRGAGVSTAAGGWRSVQLKEIPNASALVHPTDSRARLHPSSGVRNRRLVARAEPEPSRRIASRCPEQLLRV